ncbi:hypothetical protein BC831DRAFT_434103 [Entophlyctis helioformis]|nr:hypothetical protein BC831DRAFT_434103 [Entophlyctis helioformis]
MLAVGGGCGNAGWTDTLFFAAWLCLLNHSCGKASVKANPASKAKPASKAGGVSKKVADPKPQVRSWKDIEKERKKEEARRTQAAVDYCNELGLDAGNIWCKAAKELAKFSELSDDFKEFLKLQDKYASPISHTEEKDSHRAIRFKICNYLEHGRRPEAFTAAANPATSKKAKEVPKVPAKRSFPDSQEGTAGSDSRQKRRNTCQDDIMARVDSQQPTMDQQQVDAPRQEQRNRAGMERAQYQGRWRRNATLVVVPHGKK